MTKILKNIKTILFLKKRVGTSPQNYTKCHKKDFSGVPKRLHKYIPKIKLIYIVRNPIDRIDSHYKEAMEGGYAPKEGLNKYLDKGLDNHYILTSMYFFQVSKYLDFFSTNQIYIVKSEDLLNNRLSTLNKIFSFLQVDNINDDTVFNYKMNTGSNKKKKTIIGKFIFSNNSYIIRKVLPRFAKNFLKKSTLLKIISHKSTEFEKINPEKRR